MQQRRCFVPLKRVLQGRRAYLPPPSNTILDWNYSRTGHPEPGYSLKKIPFTQLQLQRTLYLEKIKELLRIPAPPGDFKMEVRVVERVKLGSLIREKAEIQTEPDLWIPFYLFIPEKGQAPLPLILVVHGHSSGKIETAGLVSSYQNGNALALAKAGFAVLTPDLRGFGELGWMGEWNDPQGSEYAKSIHIQDVTHHLRTGRTALGNFIYDLHYLLEYAKTRQEIDPDRIGIAGASMGADITLWLSLLEPGIRAAAAHHTSLLDYPLKQKDYSSFHVCIHDIPGIESFFNLHEIPMLAAPKALQISFNQNANSEKNLLAVQHIYQEAGQSEKLSFEVHQGGDSFYNQKAIEWFKKWL